MWKLTQFTGLLRMNTVAAKRDLLAERIVLGKSVSVSPAALAKDLSSDARNRIMSVYGLSRTVVPHLLQQIVD